ncbi:unnamed protein product, partial [Sphagnum jensenii]
MEVVNCKLMGERTHGRYRRLRYYASVLLALLLGVAAGALQRVESAPNPYNVTSFVIFGDSTLDAGNNNYLFTEAKANFLPYGRDFPGSIATGRFCNGQIASDFVATALGLPLSLAYLDPNAQGPRILTGINFASSGSGWDEGTANHFNVKGMNAQLEWFKDYYQQVVSLAGEQNGDDIIRTALYAIGTGTNDFLNNYFFNPALMANYSLDQYQAFLLGNAKGYIQELYSLGGRNIAVLGLPPFGCLPSQIALHGILQGTMDTNVCVTELNNVAISFNSGLQALINEMKPNLPGSRLFYVDIYSLLDTVYHNPTVYGFNETRYPCCGTYLCNPLSINTCADAAPYLFWDSFHPTSNFYKMLSNNLI